MPSLFVLSDSLDPCWNLAREEQFLQELEPETRLLFVYRNHPSVVIGKNQNPWAECWVTKLLTSDVKLVRRNSGGGTVYHDEGNLNFSFIAPREYYTVSRHFGIVLETLRRHGLSAEWNGRHDLVREGFKFSGSAFCFRKKTAGHHGTLLVSSDLERMGRFLKKNASTIQSKAIPSVPSPVCNLSSWKRGLTVDGVVEGLLEVFREQAGTDVSVLKVGPGRATETGGEDSAFQEAYRKYGSWEWNFGRTPEFSLSCEMTGRRLEMKVLEGKVGETAIDGEMLFSGMTGCPFVPDALRKLGDSQSEAWADSEKKLFQPMLKVLEETVFGKPGV